MTPPKLRPSEVHVVPAAAQGEPLPVPAAIAVMVRADRVLLVQRRNPPDVGMWGFPGGKREPGESALGNARRELAEETGLRAWALCAFDRVAVEARDGAGAITHRFTLDAVLCRHAGGELRAGDDAAAAEWVPVADVLAGARALHRDVDRVLARALALGAGRF
ncbi:NUDIX hydrolase [Phaeovulum vinaykumarii]|uniref:ADP-ribose pyrophosphatase YjhB, NUDIX family n=1 Tax=Phaeovulum vinaykumarii TaxID=407234 RepID=A0A1N7L2D1_9RHOB|nr:NUDIX hydrolase [Phaeovulum vinaykumarii]SIS68022.1 ADP-ribose pyrophosphatase YjhB, NUDIX family [Phaeovulum vinaykumarii]SOC00398.1 ADP-ribose pyrophosphatase YjhB (NUDIX family) [Phaeovulum vinaykumarii]